MVSSLYLSEKGSIPLVLQQTSLPRLRGGPLWCQHELGIFNWATLKNEALTNEKGPAYLVT